MTQPHWCDVTDITLSSCLQAAISLIGHSMPGALGLGIVKTYQ